MQVEEWIERKIDFAGIERDCTAQGITVEQYIFENAGWLVEAYGRWKENIKKNN